MANGLCVACLVFNGSECKKAKVTHWTIEAAENQRHSSRCIKASDIEKTFLVKRAKYWLHNKVRTLNMYLLSPSDCEEVFLPNMKQSLEQIPSSPFHNISSIATITWPENSTHCSLS